MRSRVSFRNSERVFSKLEYEPITPVSYSVGIARRSFGMGPGPGHNSFENGISTVIGR